MKIIKRLSVSLLLLAVALGVGWGSYLLAGPAASARETAAEHDGHGHHNESSGPAAGNSDAPAGPGHVEAEHQEDGHLEEGDHLGDGHAPGQPPVSPPPDPHAGHDHPGDHYPAGEICPEHQVLEAEDALCQPDLVAHLQPGQGLKIRLATPEVAARVGIATALPLPVKEGGANWPGQIVFNRDRLARLSALAGGTMRQVSAQLGEKVERGKILAEIASPEVAGLQAEWSTTESRRILAEAVYLREKDLLAKGVSSRQEFQQAEAELRQAESAARRAQRQLADHGLVPGDTGSVLPIRAPFAGTVIERTAVVGEIYSPGTPLFVLADLNNLWLEISIPEDALLEVHPGLAVSASFTGLPGRAFRGNIFWVAPALDERTRMLKVIAEVDNREGLLRSGLFGQVQPVPKTARATFAVPAAALQTVDGNQYLFVRLAADLFELRRVVVGRRLHGDVTINEGLNPQDRVVTAQAFSLKSEVLRARLGASCADH